MGDSSTFSHGLGSPVDFDSKASENKQGPAGSFACNDFQIDSLATELAGGTVMSEAADGHPHNHLFPHSSESALYIS